MKKGLATSIFYDVVVWIICQIIALSVGWAYGLLPTLTTLDLSTFYPYIITIIISSAATVVFITIRKRRRRVVSSNYPMISIGGYSPPSYALAVYAINMFGVDWEIEIGNSGGITRPTEYPYVKGPYCPKDHYLLDNINEPTLLGSFRPIWRCGSCGVKYPRDKKAFLKEERIVGKKVLADHQTGNIPNREEK